MPNIDAAFGLRPYRMLGSSPNSTGATTFQIQTSTTAGLAERIYQGGIVVPLANGLIGRASNDGGGNQLGVFIGCNYVGLDGTPYWSPQWPGTASVRANTEATCTIVSDPDAVFLVNCDGPAADSTIHANADLINANNGNVTNGISSGELDISTVATANALAVRIIGFDDSPINSDPTVAGRLAIVKLNNHFYNQSTGI